MILPLLAIIVFQWEIAYATPGATLVQPHDGLMTPSPELEVREILTYGDPRFIGWQVDEGAAVQRTCRTGLTYSVRGTNFACCPTSTMTCSFVYECDGLHPQVFPGRISSQCSDACITGRLYWSTLDTRLYTYVGCGTSDYWVVQSIDPSGLLSWNPGVASVAPKTTSTDTSPPPTLSPTITPPTVAPASTPETLTSCDNWWAVGGGAIGIGLIGLGVLLFLRRKRNNPPPGAPVMGQHQQYQNQPPPPDMRHMSYGSPGSPPPPFSARYSQNQNPGFFAIGKPGGQEYTYVSVPNKDAPLANIKPYHQASEVSGIPVGHAMELPGSPIPQKNR